MHCLSAFYRRKWKQSATIKFCLTERWLDLPLLFYSFNHFLRFYTSSHWNILANIHWNVNCVCASKSKSGRTNVTLLFSYLQPRHKRKSVAMAVWNEESLTGVPYIFKPLIGIASKVAPPAALPFSCCTATSVSGPGSLEGGCLGGPAGTREPNWGPRTPPSAATAVLPLADGRIKTPWLARGQRSPGGCSACRARGGSLLWWIRQCCPAVSMNFDWCPQPLSPSLPLKGKCKDDEIGIPLWYAHTVKIVESPSP